MGIFCRVVVFPFHAGFSYTEHTYYTPGLSSYRILGKIFLFFQTVAFQSFFNAASSYIASSVWLLGGLVESSCIIACFKVYQHPMCDLVRGTDAATVSQYISVSHCKMHTDKLWQIFIEYSQNQNILSWNGPTRIIKSYSWLHTELPKN